MLSKPKTNPSVRGGSHHSERQRQTQSIPTEHGVVQSTLSRIEEGAADEFVAIDNQRVLDSDADSYKLIHRLRKQYGDLGSFAVEHVGDGKVELIL